MSLKMKLISSICAFVLVLALMITGIFAATTSLTFNGTFTFDGLSSVLDVNIAGEVIRNQTEIELEDISIEKGTTSLTAPESWQDLDLRPVYKYDEESQTGVICSTIMLTITNRDEGTAINVEVEADNRVISASPSVLCYVTDTDDFVDSDDRESLTQSIPSGESKTYYIHIVRTETNSTTGSPTNIEFSINFIL